jgi:hypothetical protein
VAGKGSSTAGNMRSERMGIPGFRRSSRWKSADDGPGIFVMYELQDYEVLSSAPYLARLNAPTPWSTRMMPHHRNMIPSQCRGLESRGGAIARHALTIRVSPGAGKEEALRGSVAALAGEVVSAPGIVGMHLLRHQTPNIAPTREQVIRSSLDRVVDWVLVTCGYDAGALEQLSVTGLSDASLLAMGAVPSAERSMYTLSQSATPADVA